MTTNEFALLHPLYVAILEAELGHSVPVPQSVEAALAQNDSTAPGDRLPESCRHWLSVLDLGVNPRRLRDYVLTQKPAEATLLALIRFLVGKKPHLETDQDKLDWTLTHLFKKREEESGRPLGWPKSAVQEILQGMPFLSLSQYAQDLLMELPSLIDEFKYYEHFYQITDSHLIKRGRDLKNQFGAEFFHPEALGAIVNYNLLFGKKFYELFQETTKKVREIAKEHLPSDTAELLRSDYRSTAAAFRQLGELGRKEALRAPAPAPAPAPKTDSPRTSLDQQLKHLGVDSTQEALNLRTRAQELSLRLQSNPTITAIANPVAPLPLNEWESNALRAQYPESEQTFRAEFARGVCRAIAILARIYEEVPLYIQKKGTEFLWKKHYDSLVYLLSEGRKQKQVLLDLAAVSEQRGLREKAKQLEVTAQKLDTGLSRVAGIF